LSKPQFLLNSGKCNRENKGLYSNEQQKIPHYRTGTVPKINSKIVERGKIQQ